MSRKPKYNTMGNLFEKSISMRPYFLAKQTENGDSERKIYRLKKGGVRSRIVSCIGVYGAIRQRSEVKIPISVSLRHLLKQIETVFLLIHNEIKYNFRSSTALVSRNCYYFIITEDCYVSQKTAQRQTQKEECFFPLQLKRHFRNCHVSLDKKRGKYTT